ncbi:hypothetical protein [Acinetobacter kyonggiensis]|uniref:Uncharacterized protein n=1 Tax=Acinetobacter kyonggiensis TaxID=595670 RepID=A0A1H3HF39_9GAMM|nr:hypothetical protein [Acinetobacter kyonggiensis]SDY13950.1 hypothetical protein SAMN05421643_10456 [Acinetobacter kyonggiensis]
MKYKVIFATALTLIATSIMAIAPVHSNFQGTWATSTRVCNLNQSDMTSDDFNLKITDHKLVFKGWNFNRVEKILEIHLNRPEKVVYSGQFTETWEMTNSDGMIDSEVLVLKNGVLKSPESNVKFIKCK